MKVLILSDSHSKRCYLEEILKREQSAEIIIHLGDGADDMLAESAYTAGKALYQCAGNCDSSLFDFPKTQLINICGRKIFACHGHQYSVKVGLDKIYFAALEKGAELCLYGHTHQPHEDSKDGICFFNPGAVNNAEYAIAQISENTLKLQHKSLYNF